MLLLLISLFAFLATEPDAFNVIASPQFDEIPSLYEGRFRPLAATQALWLNDIYRRQKMTTKDLKTFELENDRELLWELHFFGHERFDNEPLIWLQQARLKEWLRLPLQQNRFSAATLRRAIDSSKNAVETLIAYQFLQRYLESSNRSGQEKFSLPSIMPGLVVGFKQNDIVIVQLPEESPWAFLKVGQKILIEGRSQAKQWLAEQQKPADELQQLLRRLQDFESIERTGVLTNRFQTRLLQLKEESLTPSEISATLEAEFSLSSRLKEGHSPLNILPTKQGTWVSLNALKAKQLNASKLELEPIANFTPYSDELFNKLRSAYLTLDRQLAEGEGYSGESEQIATLLKEGYRSLAGKTYQSAFGKALNYPTTAQLKAEALYYQLPLFAAAISAYSLALLGLGMAEYLKLRWLRWISLSWFFGAFLIHTGILVLRCFILARPPVSNMFETVLYVPWIAVFLSTLLFIKWRSLWLLISASVVSLSLLIALQVGQLSAGLENVQAVLDSQYWLIIHVLMVVGSYGVFALAAVIGHIYLLGIARQKNETPFLLSLSRLLLFCIYIGLGLLIPGTILGGVWAAESWGRFWDWDPKESWAFISACIYLVFVHAHRFGAIGNFGLAVGSVLGLVAISFTWYGVNYILGVGLHTYGFGSGGELYYYLYLLCELLFISAVTWCASRRFHWKVF